MMNRASSSSMLINVTFSGNSTVSRGGGMSNRDNSSPTLTNVTFSGNSTPSRGGGMSNRGNSSPTLTNVTLTQNASGINGGGIINDSDSDPIIRNCIIWGNVVGVDNNQIFNLDGASVPIIEDSMVQGGCPDAQTSCTNLITGPPLFVDPNGPDDTPGTLDDDLRLKDGSPAIDTGNNAHLPPDAQDFDDDNDTAENIPIDLDGATREFNGTVDLGAYESQSSTLYVNDDAAGLGSGNNWTDAYIDLQSALSRSVDGSQIWVAAGVYIPGPSEENTFQLKNGVEIYGGFEGLPGSEDDFDARDPSTFLSILSGDIDGDDNTSPKAVVTDTDDIVGDNTDHVVTGSGTDDTAVLDGFTITAGEVTLGTGAGMRNDGGSPTLTNLIFSGNLAGSGGGMYNFSNSSPMLTNVTLTGNMATGIDGGGGMLNLSSSSPMLTDVIFSGNSASNGGGGMRNSFNSSPTLTNVTFSGNSASDGGGMFTFFSSSPTLTRVTFSGNSASTNGGGMRSGGGSNPTLINVTFSGNSAGQAGGAITFTSGLPTFTNVTFSHNSAGTQGGAMYNADDFSDPIIRNCIFWGNQAGGVNNQIVNTSSVLTF